MAQTFDVIVGDERKTYEDAKEAGAAFFVADATKRPTVIHSMESEHSPGGSGRFMASTDSIGHVGGEAEYVKRLPNSHEVDKDFRAGYFNELEKSVNERLKNTDWETAKSNTPEQTPALDNRLYGDLETLSRVNFDRAATAWETHAPKDVASPAFVDREWKRQNEEARNLAGILNGSEQTLSADVAARQAIEKNNDGLLAVPRNALDDSTARDTAREDVANFSGIKNEAERFFAALAIGDTAEKQAAYKAELQGINPDIAKEAEHLRTFITDYERQFERDNRQDGAFSGINAQTRQPELFEYVDPRNEVTIETSGRKSLDGSDYELTAEDAARLNVLKENRKASELIQLEQMEPFGIDAEEKNIVEPVLEKELEIIDGKEVVDRANLLRQREREHLAREQERLGLQAEGKRIDMENLSEKAREQDSANDIAERTGGVTDRESQSLTEREKNRQAELLEQVHGQFRVNGSKFHFKDQPGKVAFKDSGERMVTASNDDRVAKAMATMAEAKGWKTIKVSGHPDFQREVWMEATLRGLEVRGYKPTEQDLKALDTKRERSMHNAIERDERERAKQPTASKDIGENRKTDSARQNSDKTAEKGSGKAPTPAALEKAVAPALRAYAGRVIEHGSANFNHDPDEKPNYFVKMATDKGEKTVWGVDLKRAMSESKIKAGDDIKLEYKGNQPVTVEALKRDNAGKVIGKEEITTNRNTWEVQKSDKHKVVEAVAAALVDSKVKSPVQREAIKAAIDARLVEREKAGKMPAVPVYDKTAPTKAQSPERTGPVVERNSERTR